MKDVVYYHILHFNNIYNKTISFFQFYGIIIRNHIINR